MSNFTFSNSAIQSLTVTNGDVVDAVAHQIQLNWNYAESYGVANGYPNLMVDWFRWAGSYIHLGGNDDGVFDSSSPTTWGGTVPFNAGSSYTWEIDFDLDWAAGGSLSDVVNNDFGVIIDFANGCQLTAGCNSQADHILDAIRHTNYNLDTNPSATADEYSAAIQYTTAFSYSIADLYTNNNLDTVYHTITDHYADSDGYSAADQYTDTILIRQYHQLHRI